MTGRAAHSRTALGGRCEIRAVSIRLSRVVGWSAISDLKELRPGSRGRSEIRILFVFDPWRSAILLVAGDKARQWDRWYERAIPHAEHLHGVHLKERGEVEAGR